MLRIRLSRVGKKKRPAYRIVVADSRAARGGAFVEVIGHYDPLEEPAKVVVKEERAIDWLRKGAQPSETVAKLLAPLGITAKAGGEAAKAGSEASKTGAKTPKARARAAKARGSPKATE